MAETSEQQVELIHAAMGVYIPEMRQHIVRRLDDKLGRDWYEAWLKDRLDGDSLPDHVRDRYVENLEAVQRGDRDPHDALGPSEFPYVLGARREHFLPDLAPLIDAMHEVLRDRTIQPNTNDTDAQQQAQRLLENCRTLLRPINEDAARRIQTLIDTGDPNSIRDARDAARRTRRSTTRRTVSERRRRPNSDDAPPRAASARSARVADSSDAPLPPVADPKGALRDIIDIYRDEMRDYISGAFQKEGIDDWLVTRVAEQAGGENSDLANRMIREYRQDGVRPDKIIDVADFSYIISNNEDVFPGILQALGGISRLTPIRIARNEFYGHDKATPYSGDVEALADNCAFVLRVCGMETAADEVERRTRASDESPEADDLAPAPERPSTQEDLELDVLRKTDLEAYRWRMGWFLKETPEEWRRHMDRLRNHDVAAWAVELLEGIADRTARNAETDRIATLGPGPRRKAMAAIWDMDAAAGRRAMRRWANQSDLRPWRDEMIALFDRNRSAWQALMDEQRQRRNKAAWRSGMGSLRSRNPEAYREEWAALRRRDEVTYRSEMNALRGRNPDAHAEVESAELAKIGDDAAERRSWFDADPQRQERHRSDYASLLEVETRKLTEEEQREMAELGDDWSELQHWFDAEAGRPGRHTERFAELGAALEAERAQQRRRQRERELRERERAEIAAFDDDLDGLRRWFDTYKTRPKRHQSEYTALLQREQERRERERTEIAALGDDWPKLQRWFDTEGGRPGRHTERFAELEAALEVERARQRELAQERHTLARMEHAWTAQRNWFDADPQRQERHPEKLADLVRAERERAELANLRDDLEAQRQRFDADDELQLRHLHHYARLEEAEAAKQLEDERAELAGLEGDTASQREWFDAVPERQQRHGAEYAALKEAEQIAQEQAELIALGDDWPGVEHWFADDAGRPERHPERFEALRTELARQRELEGERRELAKRGSNWTAQRNWFDANPLRRERHSEAFDELLLAEGERRQFAQRAGNLPAQREWFDAVPGRRQRHVTEYAALEKAELIEQERPELAALGDDWSRLQRWFDDKDGRPGRHPERFKELQAELALQRELERELEQEKRDLARMEYDWAAQRNWFDADPLRQERHSEVLAELQRAEKERAGLAELEREALVQRGGVKGFLDRLPWRRNGYLSARRKWFEKKPARRQRHRDLYEPVLRVVETEQLIEQERQDLAALAHEWSQIERWFAAVAGRPERHLRAYATLQRAERDLAQLADLGGDISARRWWFYRDLRRRVWYPRQWTELKRDARALREQEREERRREQEERTLQDAAAGQGPAGEAAQSGSSDGGGGAGAATQEGTDDGGHALPAREGEDQRASSRFRRLMVAIAAVIAISIAAYVVYASWFSADAPPEPNPLTPGTEEENSDLDQQTALTGSEAEAVKPKPDPLTGPVIDSLTCRPPEPTVGETVTCFASLSGGEPTSWLWGGGGSPPTGKGDTFSTMFSSPASRTITLTVENAVGSSSGVLAITVLPLLKGGSLSSGAGYSCRLTDDGAAACWGQNNLDQRDVLDGRFEAISAGGAHTCGLRESGAVVCWGWNGYGQLDWPPDRFVSVSAGFRHTCGITTDKAVKCWGWNEHGQSVDRDGQFSQVSAGFFHNCAIKLDGGVECWGTSGHERTQPPTGRFTTVSAGLDHTCGLRPGGSVECWGDGAASRRDEGSFSAISAGQFHNCGILASGAVRCWGNDDRGQLAAPAGNDFVQIDAGALHTCAARANREIVCWGNTPHDLDDVDSAVIGDHTLLGNDPPPE